MKLAILSLFLLGAAAAADTAEAKDELVEVFGAESSEEDTDAASRRRRRRWGHRHRPHGHWPHGHNPHWHHPHVHSPHAHSDCIEAGNERHKVGILKDTVEMHKKKKENCQAELERLEGLLPGAPDATASLSAPALIQAEFVPVAKEDVEAMLVELNAHVESEAYQTEQQTTEEIEADIAHQEACIDHHAAEMKSGNERIQNIKKKLRQNDCTDTVRWVSNAAEAVVKWIEALIEFLEKFICHIIDIAVKVLAKMLDTLITSQSGFAEMLKKMPWCAPIFKKPKKDGPTPPGPPDYTPQIKKVSYGLTLLMGLPILLMKSQITPKDALLWMIQVWFWISALIDDKRLNNINTYIKMVVYFALLVWDLLCGNVFAALMTLGKDIMYCNTDIPCDCKAPFLKF